MEKRFFQKVKPSNGCWLWTAAKDKDGYGLFQLGVSRTGRAHRIAYEMLRHPIPKGLVIDHLCKVKNCVNPFHMEVVTARENTLRADCGKSMRDKTHCPQGHSYEVDGGKLTTTGKRYCKACMRLRYHKRKGK